MNFLTKKLKFTYIEITFLTMFVCMLFVDGYSGFKSEGDNYFHIFLNGVEVGAVADVDSAEELLTEARRKIAEESDGLIFMDADITVEGEEVIWGELDREEDVLSRMGENLKNSTKETMHRAYTLKVNEYMVSLGSAEEVRALLQAAVDKYDSEGIFNVELVKDAERELGVLTAVITQSADEHNGNASTDYMAAGVEAVMSRNVEIADNGMEKGFEDFELGIKTMNFAEEVEIVDAYLPESRLSTLEQAVEEVIKEQETVGEYTIVSGDTLSEIAIKVNIPVDKIIEMNSDKLDDENSTIRAGDKLVITIPEPELSVERMEENYYEEIYDKDVVYIDNDDWYTTQTLVHQQPSAGFRRIIADVNYINDKEVSREILKEEIVQEAVAKVVERGTKIPPTYVRPISGGRQTSGFGRRNAPTKGASTYHKGVDWAVPTGTSVYASCGGTVAKAGWGSGYGYVVYINHEDGRQTRYGHLSKVLVKSGQSVKQGERIALSGNTGVSTGPHLHFEILINGTQVNPLKYLN